MQGNRKCVLKMRANWLHSRQTLTFCLAIVREREVRLLSTYTFSLLTASHHILGMAGNLIFSDEQEKTLLMELIRLLLVVFVADRCDAYNK